MFVTTNIILLQQNFCCGKHTFVATKDMFCCDKHVSFVATKIILAAPPTNDREKVNYNNSSALSTSSACGIRATGDGFFCKRGDFWLEKENDANTQSRTVFMPVEFLDTVGNEK